MKPNAHSKSLVILFGADRLDELVRAFMDADDVADTASRVAREAEAKAAEARDDRDALISEAAGQGIKFVRFLGDAATYAKAIPALPG